MKATITFEFDEALKGAGKLISVGGSLIQFRKALNYRPSAPIFEDNPENCEK